jgi:hypothetical protein
MAQRKTVSVDDEPAGPLRLPNRHTPNGTPDTQNDRNSDRISDRSNDRSELRSDLPAGDAAPALADDDRKRRRRGVKAHPRDERSKVQGEVPQFVADAVRDVMDDKLLKNGVVMSRVLEAGLRALYPLAIAEAYADRCGDLGVPNDWLSDDDWRRGLR